MSEALAPPPVAEKSKKGVRPLLVTLACCVAWFAGLWTLKMSFRFETQAFGEQHGAPWFPYFSAAVGVGGLACFVFVWRMQRVGLLAFILMTVTQNLVMLLGMHAWSPQLVVGPAVLTFVCLAYVDRMR